MHYHAFCVCAPTTPEELSSVNRRHISDEDFKILQQKSINPRDLAFHITQSRDLVLGFCHFVCVHNGYAIPAYHPFDCSAENRAARLEKCLPRLQFFYYSLRHHDRWAQESITNAFCRGGPYWFRRWNNFVRMLTIEQCYHRTFQTNVKQILFRHCYHKTILLNIILSTGNFHDIESEVTSQSIAGCKSTKVREKEYLIPLWLDKLLAFGCYG